jgi:phosphoribulokinase
MNARRPILLGIVGDSAAGKTTLTRGLVRVLGTERVTHVCIDDYHKYDRKERAERNITALHPDCNYLDVLELHLERLHYGQPILKPKYDHSNGTLVRPEYVRASEFVIVEGLLGYHTAVMRQFYDVKVFLDPPEELRRRWKVQRDTLKRGYTAEQVLAELELREADSEAFIRPQREFADIVVQFSPPEGVAPDEVQGHFNARLVLRPTIPHPDLSYLFEGEGAHGDGVRLSLGRDARRPVDILQIDGNVSRAEAERLERALWERLPNLKPLGADQFGDYYERTEVRHSDPLALTQLLLTYHLMREQGGQAQKPYAPPTAALTRLKKTASAASAEEKAESASPT